MYVMPVKPFLPHSQERAALDALEAEINAANIVLARPLATRSQRVSAHRAVQAALTRLETELPCQTTATPTPAYAAARAYINAARNQSIDHLLAIPVDIVPGGTQIEEVLGRLSAGEAAQLAQALSVRPAATVNARLGTLFAGLPATPGITAWRNFAATHTINCFHAGNVANIRVTPMLPLVGPPVILKLDFRFGDAPSAFDLQVRRELGDLLTPVKGARLAEAQAPGGGAACMRTLQVTTVCTNGGADAYASAPIAHSAARGTRACEIARQMSLAFQRMEDNNIYFPDAKLSNWLVDGAGQLRIADTKSLLRCAPNATFDGTLPENRGLGPVGTGGYCTDDVFAAAPGPQPRHVHAAILGRNLYQALTGNWPPHWPNDSAQVILGGDYTGPHAAEYARLIADLTQPTRALRPTMAEASTRLNLIAMLDEPGYALITAQLVTLNVSTGQDYSGLLEVSIRGRLTAGRTITEAVDDVRQILDEAISAANDGNIARGTLDAVDPSLGGLQLLPAAQADVARAARTAGAADLAAVRNGLKAHTESLQAGVTLLNRIKTIRTKADELDARGHGSEATRARDLCTSVENNYRGLVANTMTGPMFKNACSADINAARPVLEKHRGWKQVLGNLALAVIGLGVLYAAAGLLNKAVTGNFLFFKTDSANKVDKLEQSIESIARKP